MAFRLLTARGAALTARQRGATGSRVPYARLTTLGKAYDEKEARKWLQFTCAHKDCHQTSETDKVVRKTISTLAYEKGVVLVRCNCDKLHLIADRLGWFEDGGTDIEKIAREHGIKFDKGVIEYNPNKPEEGPGSQSSKTPSTPKDS